MWAAQVLKARYPLFPSQRQAGLSTSQSAGVQRDPVGGLDWSGRNNTDLDLSGACRWRPAKRVVKWHLTPEGFEYGMVRDRQARVDYYKSVVVWFTEGS